MPITLPIFYKKAPTEPEDYQMTPERSKKTLWVVIAILVNIALAASAIVISRRLKKEEYIPPEEVPAAVEILCKNPIDVALVIDRSGSMKETSEDPPQPMTDVKNAAKTFVEAINVTSNPEETDQVAVVSFNAESPATLEISLTNDTTAINVAIDGIEIEGGTAIGSGIKAGTDEILSRSRTEASKALVIISDGVSTTHSDGTFCADYPTTPNACTQDVIDQAQLAKDAGITVYTIGLGLEGVEARHPGTGVLAEETLKQAASGESSYFAAPNSSDLENIYITIAERVCEMGVISGSVFNDWNQDGIWGAEEPALSGWTLTITYEGSPQTIPTDAEGSYTFTNLLPGSYSLSITPQPEWIQTLAASPTFNLPEGETIGDLDFAFYDPNATHLTCQGGACVPTSGGGIDECGSDADCTSPTHKVCVSERCSTVDGAGVDTCITDSDCVYEAPRVHRICSGNSCVEAPGEGTDECSSDSDCAATVTETHRECQGSLCAVVTGAGADECVVNSDCVSEVQPSEPEPTGGTSTPSASPSAAPDTGRIAPTLAIFVVSLILLSLGALMAI